MQLGDFLPVLWQHSRSRAKAAPVSPFGRIEENEWLTTNTQEEKFDTRAHCAVRKRALRNCTGTASLSTSCRKAPVAIFFAHYSEELQSDFPRKDVNDYEGQTDL